MVAAYLLDSEMHSGGVELPFYAVPLIATMHRFNLILLHVTAWRISGQPANLNTYDVVSGITCGLELHVSGYIDFELRFIALCVADMFWVSPASW
jgi:hypothetical protein